MVYIKIGESPSMYMKMRVPPHVYITMCPPKSREAYVTTLLSQLAIGPSC